MPRVIGLGHIGLYVRDIEAMTAFYRDFLGMQITKQNRQRGMVFFSTDPVRSDHEVVIMSGRPADDEPHLIEQISLGVESLADLREFYRRILAAGLRIHRVVNHGSAIGCYFFDPEGNRTEVFWRTPYDTWYPHASPVDLDAMTDEDILEQSRQIHARIGAIPIGGTPPEPVPA